MKKKIICFAGLDGSGKTTQAILTNEWLNESGYDTEFVRFHTEPTKIENMEIVRKSTEYLIQNKLMLSISEIQLIKEAFHVKSKWENIILSAISKEKNIVFDRYVETYDAYKVLTDKKKNWVRVINESFPNPNYYFFIDVLPEVCFERIQKSGRRISDHETIELLRKARKYYLDYKEDYSFIVIDGNGSREQINKQIKEYIIKISNR